MHIDLGLPAVVIITLADDEPPPSVQWGVASATIRESTASLALTHAALGQPTSTAVTIVDDDGVGLVWNRLYLPVIRK